MVEQLFGSKTRVKLLRLFYSNPNRSFYVREITRKIDEQINSVRRELANLLNIGIISSDTTDNKLFYEVNQKYEFYDPLQQIFGGGVTASTAAKKSAKTTKTAVVADVDEDIRALGNVHLLLYTGQFTRDESSGIDVLIVGDINPTQLNKFISGLEEKEGKELRYTHMSPSDFHYRREVKDRFLSNIMSSKKQVLIDQIIKEG
ncbi:MAG: transcriptional regulator [Candidatus Saccharibacteria bacterium]|nr:transcriptional regulator [Candidatus Saccharibacteria bacterium]